MAKKKEEETMVMVSIPRRVNEKDDVRLYNIDGVNYTVPLGRPTPVSQKLYDAIVISGDLENRG